MLPSESLSAEKVVLVNSVDKRRSVPVKLLKASVCKDQPVLMCNRLLSKRLSKFSGLILVIPSTRKLFSPAPYLPIISWNLRPLDANHSLALSLYLWLFLFPVATALGFSQ